MKPINYISNKRLVTCLGIPIGFALPGYNRERMTDCCTKTLNISNVRNIILLLIKLVIVSGM